MAERTDFEKFVNQYYNYVNTDILESRQHRRGLRLGQILFNVLMELDPEVANMIRGHWKFDPFYKDANIPDFLEEVFGPDFKNLFVAEVEAVDRTINTVYMETTTGGPNVIRREVSEGL